MEIDQKEEAATPTLVDKDGKELEAQLLPQRIRDLHQQRNQETTTIIQNTASLLTEHSAMMLPKEMKIKEDNEIKAYYAVDFLGVRHRVIDHYIPQIICQIDTWISLLLQSGYRRGDSHQERNFRNNILVSIRFFSILLSSTNG